MREFGSVNNAYFDWMVSEVLDFRLQQKYSRLMKTLDSIVYRHIVPGDQNRITDALYMRQDWCRANYVEFDLCDSCSVLELLVSFAKRIDKEWTSSDREDHPEIIFAMFLENLDLDGFDNYYIDNYTDSGVHDIINNWMDGHITRNGSGGLFPLDKKKATDQRGKDLWTQMMPWISENFS